MNILFWSIIYRRFPAILRLLKEKKDAKSHFIKLTNDGVDIFGLFGDVEETFGTEGEGESVEVRPEMEVNLYKVEKLIIS